MLVFSLYVFLRGCLQFLFFYTFRQTRRENVSLKTSNNEISADLERLLNQPEVCLLFNIQFSLLIILIFNLTNIESRRIISLYLNFIQFFWDVKSLSYIVIICLKLFSFRKMYLYSKKTMNIFFDVSPSGGME